MKKMKFLVIISVLATISTAQRRCPGIMFNDRYYDIELLKEGVNRIHDMALNRNDNTVYFTFDQISHIPFTSLGFMNLNTRSVGMVEGIRNASGIAIDQSRNKVYVGTADGLHLINANHVPVKLPVTDKIRNLFFKDVLYFVTSRRQALTFEDGYVSPVRELTREEVDALVLDDDNNIFFLQGRDLYRIKLGTRAINTHERFKVDYMTTDPYYKPYFVTDHGIYVYNKHKFALDYVSTLKNVKALTFNRQFEPIYAAVGFLVKLNYNRVTCSEY